MRTRSALLLVVGVVGAAVGLVGCPESCALESPEVQALASCTAQPSQPVSYPVRLCPTCNQTGASCDVQISGQDIFLDVKVEACTDSNACGGAGCAPGPTSCSFTAPAATGTYRVFTFNGGTSNTIEGTLQVTTAQAPSCAFPPTAGL